MMHKADNRKLILIERGFAIAVFAFLFRSFFVLSIARFTAGLCFGIISDFLQTIGRLTRIQPRHGEFYFVPKLEPFIFSKIVADYALIATYRIVTLDDLGNADFVGQGHKRRRHLFRFMGDAYVRANYSLSSRHLFETANYIQASFGYAHRRDHLVVLEISVGIVVAYFLFETGLQVSCGKEAAESERDNKA